MLLHTALQMPVGRLHVALLVGAAHVDGQGAQIVVGAQIQVVGVVGPLAGVDLVRGRTAVVGGQMSWGLAQLAQAGLDPGHQAQKRLGLATDRPLPVRVGQHPVAEQMVQGLPLHGHPELAGVRPVHFQQPSGHSRLTEHHFLFRPRGSPPLPHSPLKRPEVSGLQSTPGSCRQELEQRLGFQLRGIGQHRAGLGPHSGQRIGPCPPPVGPSQLFRRADTSGPSCDRPPPSRH